LVFRLFHRDLDGLFCDALWVFTMGSTGAIMAPRVRARRNDCGGKLPEQCGMRTRGGEGKTNSRVGFDDGSTELEQAQADGGTLGSGENVRLGDRVASFDRPSWHSSLPELSALVLSSAAAWSWGTEGHLTVGMLAAVATLNLNSGRRQRTERRDGAKDLLQQNSRARSLQLRWKLLRKLLARMEPH
jgi:hypothetical protein